MTTHEGLRTLAEKARDTRLAYDAHDDGPDALELSLDADEALEALDQVAQPYQNLVLALLDDNERMRRALEPFARYYDLNDCDEREDDDALEVPIRDLRQARAALTTGEDK